MLTGAFFMSLQVEKMDQTTIITFNQATVEANNVPALWDEIVPLLDDTTQLVFDLSQVDFIDSTGCGIFPNCVKRLSEKDGELKICGLSDKLAALFRLMAFDRLMDIMQTREEAIAAFDS
jgi:anti-sigma B factor antagonist